MHVWLGKACGHTDTFSLGIGQSWGICPTESEIYHSTQTDLPQLSVLCQDNDMKSCFTAETSQVDQMMYERQQNPLK